MGDSKSTFVSVYSGKPLSEVPFDHLWVGTPVVSEFSGEGVIAKKFNIDPQGKAFKGVKINYQSKAVEIGMAAIFKHVKVK